MNENDYFKLHTEWLKFKSCLYDMNTGLPIINVIMDDIRKLLDEYDKLAVIYVDVSKDIESLYGWQVYDKLIRLSVNRLNSLKKEMLPASSIISLTSVRSGEVVIIFPTDKSGNTLSVALVEKLIHKMSSTLENELPGWEPDYVFATKIFRFGYSFLKKQTVMRTERLIFSAIQKSKRLVEMQKKESRLDRDLNLEYIIVNNEIDMVYQPIIYMDDLSVLGYEALARVENAGFLSSTEILFSYAVETDMLLDLERICRTNAIKRIPGKLKGKKLFLNSSAKGIYDPEFQSRKFDSFLKDNGMSNEDVVIEITERLAVSDYHAFTSSIKILKDKGYKIAIDDMGAGYSSLRTIAEIKPDYLKYDMALIRDIHQNLIKKDLLETLIPFTERLGANIIAEGIETENEYHVLKKLGIKFGQGYYFARPSYPFPEIKVKPVD
ncbi:MAG: EAL domain-containing protein [bacterium]